MQHIYDVWEIGDGTIGNHSRDAGTKIGPVWAGSLLLRHQFSPL